jgi:DNA processing protein
MYSVKRERSEIRVLLTLSMMFKRRMDQLLYLLKAYENPFKTLNVARKKAGTGGIEGIDETSVDKAMQVLDRKGIRLVSISDTDYPQFLRYIAVPPPLIFIYGDPAFLAVPVSIAIVGTRRASQYGMEVSRWLASSLAAEGIPIVSGMARGIDTEAHTGCLEGGEVTIAVLGTGIDVSFPRENAKLMDRISRNGCVISEFPPSTPGYPQNFPQRNRIISGLSSGVVVVEAPTRSGALITANYALEQGKTVFTIPGEIWSNNSKGTNRLLRDGAIPVFETQDVLDALGWQKRRQSKDPEKPVPEKIEQAKLPPLKHYDLSPVSSRLVDNLSLAPLHVDEISAKCELSSADTLGELLKLEMMGLVEQKPGKYFILRKI